LLPPCCRHFSDESCNLANGAISPFDCRIQANIQRLSGGGCEGSGWSRTWTILGGRSTCTRRGRAQSLEGGGKVGFIRNTREDEFSQPLGMVDALMSDIWWQFCRGRLTPGDRHPTGVASDAGCSIKSRKPEASRAGACSRHQCSTKSFVRRCLFSCSQQPSRLQKNQGFLQSSVVHTYTRSPRWEYLSSQQTRCWPIEAILSAKRWTTESHWYQG